MKQMINVILAVILICGMSVAATYNVTTDDELDAALGNATGGDVILLADGHYGRHYIKDRNYNDYVTIKSANGQKGMFYAVDLENCSYISVQSITAVPGAREGFYVHGNSHHIELLDSRIYGECQYDRQNPEYTQVCILYGVQVNNGNVSHVRIENNYITDIKASGMAFFGCSDIIVKDNECDWMAADGYKFAGVDNALFENNTGMRNVFSSPTAHVDFFQAQGIVTNSTFRGNVAIMDKRSFQALFFGSSEPHANNLIENNIIYNGHINAISINSNGVNNTVRYNTVLNALGEPHSLAAVGGNIREHNIFGCYIGKSGPDGTNLGIQYEDPSKPYYYNDYYQDAMHGPGLTIEDLRPVPGSAAETEGAYQRIYELLGASGIILAEPLPKTELPLFGISERAIMVYDQTGRIVFTGLADRWSDHRQTSGIYYYSYKDDNSRIGRIVAVQ